MLLALRWESIFFCDFLFPPPSQQQRGKTMERNDGKKLKVTAGLVAAGVIGLTMQAQGARHNLTPGAAEHALVYGHVDATWVQRTGKLAADNPELAKELGRIAQSTSLDGVRRGQALDALAQAGSDEAQKAMRDALAARAVMADPTYPLLVTRLGQISVPTSQTLAFVEVTRGKALSEGNAELAMAAQQTLDDVYGHRLATLYKNTARQARASFARQRGE
jgi:hypothetical protein